MSRKVLASIPTVRNVPGYLKRTLAGKAYSFNPARLFPVRNIEGEGLYEEISVSPCYNYYLSIWNIFTAVNTKFNALLETNKELFLHSDIIFTRLNFKDPIH